MGRIEKKITPFSTSLLSHSEGKSHMLPREKFAGAPGASSGGVVGHQRRRFERRRMRSGALAESHLWGGRPNPVRSRAGPTTYRSSYLDVYVFGWSTIAVTKYIERVRFRLSPLTCKRIIYFFLVVINVINILSFK